MKVAAVTEIPPGQARVVEAAGQALALFHLDGGWFALANECPHRGGPLGEGDVEGRLVSCPWHGWRWDVSTGANASNPAVGVACFPVSVEGPDVFVEMP